MKRRMQQRPGERKGAIAAVSLLCALLGALQTVDVAAQKIQFGAQSGPYYVGEPVVVQILISGVDSKTKVTCALKSAAPAGLDVQGPEVGRSSRSFTQIINGRMSSSESIDYRFQFVVTANKAGDYMVGPFEVTANGKGQEVAGRRFQFDDLESDADMRIDVSVPGASIYVGQEVPVVIRWSFTGDIEVIKYAFSSLQIRSPLFDQFTFRDEPPRTRTTLSIATAKGRVEIDAKVSQEKMDGREFVVVTGTRIMVPDSPGQFREIPVTCRTQKVISWNRSFFGDLVPGKQAPALAAGDPVSLVIKPIPQKGRPPSFSNAVGRGFSIDASANRSVVRVGDPISLNITVRGDGNLSRISLPSLDSNEGLGSEEFQIPQDQATGKIDGNSKQFNVTVRVKDPAVTQIPAIGFSWFDPYQEQFNTSVSKPIALQVMDTKVVSANDVISSVPKLEGTKGSATEQENRSLATDSGGMTFVGANLAIKRDPSQLLAHGSAISAPRTITVICYSLSLMLLVGSIVARRRLTRDRTAIDRRKGLKQIQGQIERAGRLPEKEAAEQISRALRDLIADFDILDRREIDLLLQRCDNVIYTTGKMANINVPELVLAATRLVEDAKTR